MELFDYVKFRWKELVALLVIGLTALLWVGQQSQGSLYTARTQLLLRPPATQSSGYVDPELYVTTQLVLMTTPEYLEAEAAGTSLSPDQLRAKLALDNPGGTPFVVLNLQDENPRTAVELANTVATNYLAYSQEQDSQGFQREQETLTDQIAQSRKELKQANEEVAAATATYLAANPDVRSVSPDAVAPEASTTLSIYRGRLQQLLQQRSDYELEQAVQVNTSEVLREARSASLAPGWGKVTYLAGLAGLVLVLLTLAAAGLSMSPRLVSPARWSLATDGRLPPGIRLRSMTSRGRAATTRRVATALAAMDADGAVLVTYLPERTPSLRRRTAFLLSALEERGAAVREVDSFADLHRRDEPGAASGERNESVAAASKDATAARTTLRAPASPTLLVVDLARTRTEDVGVLLAYDTRLQQTLPVLV